MSTRYQVLKSWYFILTAVRVVLIETQEAGNVGSTARVMKNFGLSELYLVNPQCLTPQGDLEKAAYFMSTHAKDIVENAVRVSSTREALKDRTFVMGTTARQRSSGAHDIYTPRDAARSFEREGLALMFGPEASGLSNEDLDYCQAYITIPTTEWSSLNLAQAVNLIAYEFFTTQVNAGETALTTDLPASREELEQLYERFFDTSDYIGYTDITFPNKTYHMYRRIFDRARLTRREAKAMLGLWHQMRWAANQTPDKFPRMKKEND